jgi:hypothetical protein
MVSINCKGVVMYNNNVPMGRISRIRSGKVITNMFTPIRPLKGDPMPQYSTQVLLELTELMKELDLY